ncbi:MAG: hypothetical protein WKG32_15190, partial [Gemmatimonadaceae bacterium]
GWGISDDHWMGNFTRSLTLARRTATRLIPGAGRPARCGGCGAGWGEGARMVSGPGVYLCEPCFGRAAARLAPRRPPADAVRCRFCRQLRPPAEVTSVGSVAICADCLGVMEGVLAERARSSPHAT